MPSKQELQTRKNELADEIKRQRDAFQERRKAGKTGKELWPDESRAAWDKVNKEYNDIDTQLDEERQAEEVEKRFNDVESQRGTAGGSRSGENPPGLDDALPGDNPLERRELEQRRETTELAMQAWAGWRFQQNRSERHLEAARACGIDPSHGEIVLTLSDNRAVRSRAALYRQMHYSLAEERALSAQLGTSGGVTIGSTLIRSLEVNMLAYSGVEQVAEVMMTDGGEEMGWPTADDTSNEGEIIGENKSHEGGADPKFSAVKWRAYEVSSRIVKVPVALLQDTAFVMATGLGDLLGERVGRRFNRACTTGTGASEPKGIVTAASLGITAASKTAIQADEIIRLEHAVDPAYRGANAGYMGHDNIYLEIRLLKNAAGGYLWQNGLREGMPDTLNGYRATRNQHMASSVAASAKTLLFGDLRSYKIRRVRKIIVRRLTERFAEQNQEGFLTIIRQDGNLLTSGTARVVYLQQAA